MKTINLLWPEWARLAARLAYRTVQARGPRCWRIVNLAGSLMLDGLHRERKAHRRREQLERSFLARLRRKGFQLVVVLFLGLLAAPAAAADGQEEDEDKGSALYRALGVVMYGAKAGDFVSTELLLAAGGRELNPLMQERGARVAATIAAPIVVNWTSEELRKNGHPKVALWMRIGAIAAFGYVTAHNLRLR